MPFSKGESEPKTRQKEDIGPDSSKNGAIEELRLTWLLKLLVGITLVGMSLQIPLSTSFSEQSTF